MKRAIYRIVASALFLTFFINLLPILRLSAAYGNGYTGGKAGEGVGIYAHGVDLSEWQGGNVDFNKIKQQGYRFVILRAGYSVYTDKYFERNYTAAKAAGLDVGVYLYSYADTVEEVLCEADSLKVLLHGKKLEYPVYFDMEDPEIHAQMSATELTALSMAFLDSMADDGWLVGLYSCKSWLDGKLETQKICEQYECWMALYLPSGSCETYDRYDESCGMWQYSSTGSVDGVPGNVDMNVAFKDYPSICALYGLNGYSPSGESLFFVGAPEMPVVIAPGESLPIGGHVGSNEGKLTNVSIGVYDLMGNMVTGRSAGPKTENYDISAISSGVDAASLPVGTYFYRVTATNAVCTRIIYQHEFIVSEAGVKAVNVISPQNLTQGERYSPEGELISSTVMREVRIKILTDLGTKLLEAVASPNTNKYALSALEQSLNTEKLTLGDYIYEVTVTTEKGTQTICSDKFSVWVEHDPITLVGFNLKDEYHPNELIGLLGTVSSENSDLREVSVTITHSNETESILRAQACGGKEISLPELNVDLALHKLSFGSYICTVSAINDAGPIVLIEKHFIIRPDGLSLCDFKMPVVLYEGDSFKLSGAVASDDSPLELVSVAVLDERRQVVIDAATMANVYTFDLAKLSNELIFSSLAPGVYTLRIIAENAVSSEMLCNSQFTVSASPDLIAWEDTHTCVRGISYAAHSTPTLYGTLMSTESEISVVRVEILSDKGDLVNAEQIESNAKSFDISRFNSMIRFQALAEGNYILRVYAQNDAGSYIMLDEEFSICLCSHSNVRSGAVSEQRCDRVGSVSDSRCSDCGQRVISGMMLDADPHSFVNGTCVFCGQNEMNNYTLQRSFTIEHGGRYVLAYCNEEHWYALDMEGNTVAISEPDENGSITVNASLLWTAQYRSGALRLCNPFGESLCLDSNGLSVAMGSANASLCLQSYDNSIFLFLERVPLRALAIHTNHFCMSEEAAGLLLFELPI